MHVVDQPRQSPPDAPASNPAEAGLFESLGRSIDGLPQVKSAEQLVRQAQAELQRAQDHYQRVRSEAVSQLHTLRDKSASDLLEGALDYVRRHPGQGVLGSVLLGFLLSRILRR